MKTVVSRNQDAYNQLMQIPMSDIRGSEALEKGATTEEKVKSRNTQLHTFVDYAKSLVDGGYWDKFDFVMAAYTAEAFFPLTNVWFYSPASTSDVEDTLKYVLANPRPMFEKLTENGLFKSIIATKSIDDLVKQFKREVLTCFWTNAKADEETLWSDFRLVRLFPFSDVTDAQNFVLVSKSVGSMLGSIETFSRHSQVLTLRDPSASPLKHPMPDETHCQTVFGWIGSSLRVTSPEETKEEITSISLDGKTVCPHRDIRGHIARALVFLSDKYPDNTNGLARFLKYDTLLDWIIKPATLRDIFWQMILIYIQRDIDPRMFVSPQTRRASASKSFVGVRNMALGKSVSQSNNPFSLACDQAYDYEPFPDRSVTVLHHTDMRQFRVRERNGDQVKYLSTEERGVVDPRHVAAIKQYKKDHLLE